MQDCMTEYELSNKIIGSAIEIHEALGSGLLESAYKECLYYKLIQQGLKVDKERPMPLIFENAKLDCGYRLDLLVENKVVIEITSVEAFNDIHLAQTLTYLKLGNFRLGLFINLNVLVLKTGIKRVVNGFPEK
jgi:GxxExxY protein